MSGDALSKVENVSGIVRAGEFPVGCLRKVLGALHLENIREKIFVGDFPESNILGMSGNVNTQTHVNSFDRLYY